MKCEPGATSRVPNIKDVRYARLGCLDSWERKRKLLLKSCMKSILGWNSV